MEESSLLPVGELWFYGFRCRALATVLELARDRFDNICVLLQSHLLKRIGGGGGSAAEIVIQ